MPATPSAADAIDRAGSRPDFLVLCYPGDLVQPLSCTPGRRRNLLGDESRPEAGGEPLQ